MQGLVADVQIPAKKFSGDNLSGFREKHKTKTRCLRRLKFREPVDAWRFINYDAMQPDLDATYQEIDDHLPIVHVCDLVVLHMIICVVSSQIWLVGRITILFVTLVARAF